jgi:D-arabinose 1-dehydrogenase-like Zn-dependent alcohol dehydrogenase
VRVHAYGVCHSDVLAKDHGYPGGSHQLISGHEIAGDILPHCVHSRRDLVARVFEPAA